MTIPPDEDSCTQHILRSHLITFIWKHSSLQIIPNISKYENGWKLSDGDMIVPVWGTQLPHSCTNNKQRKRNINDSYERDDENQKTMKNK